MGLLDDISGVLTNPQLQMLAPMVLGAAGGAMTSPPMSGTRGAIGHGILGAVQGYEKGQEIAQKGKMDTAQLQEIQQHTANMKLEATKAQNALDDETKFNQWVDSVAPGMPKADAEQLRAMTTAGDRQGAIGFWANSNQATRDQDGKIISQVFGGDAKTISELPVAYRQQYRQAAIAAQSAGGDVVQSADAVFLVNKRTGQSTQLKNPDGSPMRPMQPFLKEMQMQGMLERTQEEINARQQYQRDVVQERQYSDYLRNQDNLQRVNEQRQRDWDNRVKASGLDPTDPDSAAQIKAAYGERPPDLPEPLARDDYFLRTSGTAPPRAPAPVDAGSAGTEAGAPPSGTAAAPVSGAATAKATPPAAPPSTAPTGTPTPTRPAARPTSATSPKPPTTAKKPSVATQPSDKVMAEAKAKGLTFVGKTLNPNDGKYYWKFVGPDGKAKGVPVEGG